MTFRLSSLPFKVQGSKFKVQRSSSPFALCTFGAPAAFLSLQTFACNLLSLFKVQGSKFKVQGSSLPFGLWTFASLAVFVLSLQLVIAAATSLPPVPTTRHALTNIYHGVSVSDDYQWLEDPTAPAVRDWMRLQNERTRAYFKDLSFREGIAQQLLQLRSDESARIFGLAEKKSRIFALRFKPPAQQPILVRYSSLY